MGTNFFLYLTTFVCGASIMGVELSASRFMAPYYGSSSIIWTIIIGVLLVAMSVGNFLGGILADRPEAESRLYLLIWLCSIWIAVIPFVGKYAILLSTSAILFLSPDLLIVGGSLFSCLALFFLPCLLLGAVSPCLAKVATKNLENNGRVLGELFGFSTLGSIVGTILPTFVSIPLIGTSKTFFLFAAMMNFLSILYFFKKRKNVKIGSMTFSIMVLILIAPVNFAYGFWTSPVIEKESAYNYLAVNRNGLRTTLSTHVLAGVQSVSTDGQEFTEMYYDLAILAHFFLKKPDFIKPLDILVLGFGTGTFAKLCGRFFPGNYVEGVEIDPTVISLGKEFFSLSDKDAKVYFDDGRVFLSRTEKVYKIIFLDAFQDFSYPFHMATKEFFELVKSHLASDGVLVINVNLPVNFEPSLSDYVQETAKGVFPKVFLLNHPNYYNKIIFATKNVDGLRSFKENIGNLNENHPMYRLATQAQDGIKEVFKSNFCFTDDLSSLEIIGFKTLQLFLANQINEVISEGKKSL